MFLLCKILKLNLLILLLLLTSCAGPQPIKLSDWSAGLQTEWIQIKDYKLVLLEQAAKNNEKKAIHIYIEGDGTPWQSRFFIARDPTPRYPLALTLMKQDPQLSFYLGRPCYFQLPDFYKTLSHSNNNSPCNFHFWTDARYSSEVVELMKNAIQEKMKTLPTDTQSLPIILIGHSGGGTLAMLIAQQLSTVRGVITIAANIDTDAWTTHQGYSPLSKSVNLANAHSLRKIPQVHFGGSIDEVVPPKINQPIMKKLEQSLTIIDGFDHSCCWLNSWPTLLLNAEQQLEQQNRSAQNN